MSFHTEALPIPSAPPNQRDIYAVEPTARLATEERPARRSWRQRAANILGGFTLFSLGAASSFVTAEAMTSQDSIITRPIIVDGHAQAVPFSMVEQGLGSSPVGQEPLQGPPSETPALELPSTPEH